MSKSTGAKALPDRQLRNTSPANAI